MMYESPSSRSQSSISKFRTRVQAPGIRASIPLVFTVLILLLGALPARGQVVAGTVLDANTGQPLVGTQISVEGTQTGTLAGSGGRFVLEGLQGAEVTLRVEMIGYSVVTETVRIGDTAIQITLSPQAIALDEIVVTGQARAVELRSLGTVLATVSMPEQLERQAPVSLGQMLATTVPGVRIRNSGGEIGAGQRLKIRGAASLALGSEPIYFVDGIRIDARETAPSANRQQRTPPSRLNDLPLDDIESIEIIKGPAAATLYGTEAGNGVVHIITKKGTLGAPRFDFQVRTGANFLRSPENVFPVVWARDPTTNQLMSLNVVKSEQDRGTPVFSTGQPMELFGSVSGSTPGGIRYYLSGSTNRDEGIVEYHWLNRMTGRSNLSYTTGGLSVAVNMGLIHQTLNNEGVQQPITGDIIYGDPRKLNTRSRGMYRETNEEMTCCVQGQETIDRMNMGLNLTYSPYEWFNHRLTAGFDSNNGRSFSFWPRTAEQPGPFRANSLGRKDVLEDHFRTVTLDYAMSATTNLFDFLSTETSMGAQFYQRENTITTASGRTFPVPGLETVTSAATRTAGEEFIENKTMGVYVQQQFGFKNRLFLTGAVRADDNSAFGENFDVVVYPKASASWVITEEPFWNSSFVNTMKLRAAWGRAGQQPDVFAATRLYAPITGPGGSSALTRANIGNPDLEPEVGEEIELGFDASFLDERVAFEFTYYNQTRDKAIVAQAALPSLGFPGVEFVNVGKIRNKGIELGLGADIIRQADWGWNVGGSFSTTDNKVEDLGGLKPPQFGAPWAGQRHVEGYPVGSLFMKNVLAAQWDGSGNLTGVMCEGGDPITGGGAAVPCDQAGTAYQGQPFPAWDFGLNTSLRYKNVRLNTTIDAVGGYVKCDTRLGWTQMYFRNTREMNIDPPERDPILAAHDQMGGGVCRIGLIDAGFAKLRDVSLQFDVPAAWAERVGSSTASVTLSGQNLATLWIAQSEKFGVKVVDPETHATSGRPTYAGVNSSSHGMVAYIQDQWPTYQRIVLTVKASF